MQSIKETTTFFERRYRESYVQPSGYQYALCLKSDNIPIGYFNAGTDKSHDLGYGLLKEFWHRGIVTEAGKAVVKQLKRMAYLTLPLHTILRIPVVAV